MVQIKYGRKLKNKAPTWSKFQVPIVKVAVFVYCFLLLHLLLLAVKLMLSLYPLNVVI
jgi:hypothetical protein